MHDVLHIVMPAYNEQDNIEKVILDYISVLKYIGLYGRSKIVVADSGSTDNTHALLLDIQKDYPETLIILSDTPKEHGPKLMTLYDYAVKNSAEYVFQTDSDDQVPARQMVKFWANRNKRNVILGWRKDRGDGLMRAMVEHVVCLLLWIYFEVRIPDANAPFRLMKTRVLRRYLDKIPKDYAIPNIILTAFFVRMGENVGFCRIPFSKRENGTNSINLKKIFKLGVKSLKDFRGFRRVME